MSAPIYLYCCIWSSFGNSKDRLTHQITSFLRVSFLIAGHMKFSPHLLYSKISQTYNWSDISTREKPKNVIAIYADVVIDDGTIVWDWRKVMAK